MIGSSIPQTVKEINTVNVTDIAIDCETLDTRPTAAVIAIGACGFDNITGKLHPTPFYCEITLDSAMRAGTVSGSTLAWWMQQNDAARQLFNESNDKTELSNGLMALGTWYRALSGSPSVWGNGPDVAWLENAYARGTVGQKEPWSYWKVRDQRTIVNLAELLTPWNHSQVTFRGVKHNARDDAIHQATVIAAAYQALAQPAKPSKPTKTTKVVVDEEL